MPKESLKDKVHGNVLDLGLRNIRTVVVEDLVSIIKELNINPWYNAFKYWSANGNGKPKWTKMPIY